MKIVHIAPNSPYNDYWGYQENLLPKYQKKLGNDVTIITTNTMFVNDEICEVPCKEYDLNDGVHVIRLKRKKYSFSFLTSLKSYLSVFDYLVKLDPDLIFFHGLISSTIFDVIKYKKKHPKCIVFQDNHMDYNIGFKVDGLKSLIIRFYYRKQNKKSISYVDKVFGVTPWRRKYAEEYFNIPKAKTDLLIMGADDEKINFYKKNEIRNTIRKQYGIYQNEFLIVTGGKIDKNKKIDQLMEACSNRSNIKLIVFGTISKEVKNSFEEILKKSNNIIYVGWISSDSVYDYFLSSDLVFFPGQHSVLWEQACASKVPCVFEKWDYMNHVDNGGNCDFISPVNIYTISEKISELFFTEKYNKMKEAAESEKTDIFLYSVIAKKTLEILRENK